MWLNVGGQRGLGCPMEEGQATIQRRGAGLQRSLGGRWEGGGTRRD